MKPGRFRHFAAIDWSGAAGERHAGIAVALCGAGDAAPALIRPGHRWSRGEVLEWLLEDMPCETLVGFDMGISLPFADGNAFFPGSDVRPGNARALWELVDQICAEDPDLGVSSFVDHPEFARYFRRQRQGSGASRVGDRFLLPNAVDRRGRLRETEKAQARLGCSPTSNFNLVGAAQVGKSSLSGMRLLHRLGARLPVWPVDDLPPIGSVVVEIYTTIAALAARRPKGRSKVRVHEELNLALDRLGSAPVAGSGPIADHAADALVTAAWLRTAAHRPALWQPQGLTPALAATEGWTFGAP